MAQTKNNGPHNKLNSPYLQGIFLLFCCLLLTAQTARAQSRTNFEERTKLKASSLLSPDLLKSSLHTVDEAVLNDGLINRYTVRSVFGVFQADSTPAVKQLIHEIRAIAAMKKVATKSTATASVVQSGKNTIDAVANLVTEPKATLAGATTGMTTLFNRATEVIGKRKTTDAEDSKVEQLIGKSKSKGTMATTFGVSVYSRNPVLQKELDRLAWADYLGGIGVGLAQSAVPDIGGMLLRTSGTARLLNDVINNTPASELWVRNKNKLTAMNVPPDPVQLYLNNPYFSPELQTIMVEALETLQGVANRELFITVSLQANSYEMARTITEIASMAAGYHQHIAPLQSFSPMARVVQATARNGAVIVLFPADHMLWSAKVADIASWLIESRKMQDTTSAWQIWIPGDFSRKARTELQAMGWEIHPAAQSRLLPPSQKS